MIKFSKQIKQLYVIANSLVWTFYVKFCIKIKSVKMNINEIFQFSNKQV